VAFGKGALKDTAILHGLHPTPMFLPRTPLAFVRLTRRSLLHSFSFSSPVYKTAGVDGAVVLLHPMSMLFVLLPIAFILVALGRVCKHTFAMPVIGKPVTRVQGPIVKGMHALAFSLIIHKFPDVVFSVGEC
jgi:hypothetical protein